MENKVQEGMPTIFRSGPYRFFFYSGDREEPPHIHVQPDEDLAKFWLEPVRLQDNNGFRASELGAVQRLVVQRSQELIEAWQEYFED